MWLVCGIDEEHRFREWDEAAGYHRLMVGDWVARHGDPAGAAGPLDGLAVGQSSTITFPDPEPGPDDGGDAGTVEFSLTWERARAGLEVIGAC
ncbi:hypothetical protein [Pseudonocardia sp. N23]|uniref:hypothetical protein n=1 Tax=Pseudonocardia sp. N23 TaxID=1987376 RepID=UPI000BFC2CD2|nr:hypothetical protein [Pseudonocardia sp. N23]GAY07575.1 hypothetical protein TOK_3595 [Pseudonocardia sp. N23]